MSVQSGSNGNDRASKSPSNIGFQLTKGIDSIQTSPWLKFMRTVLALLVSTLLSIASTVAQDVQFAQHVDVSGDGWVYYNLSENRVVSEQEASFGAWDVSFKGTAVTFNGPSQLLDVTFDAVDAAPEEGYTEGEDGTSELPTDAETRWFNYDFTNHTISAKPNRTAVFQMRDGRWAKLNITDYYKVVFGADPIPRMLSFRWVIGPSQSRRFEEY
jgi:hypothetical protein